MARVTRESFFTAAFALLAQEGFPGVTAAGLCQRLGVTRGSFYHHFGSFEIFIKDLTAHWQRLYTDNLVAMAQEERGPLGEQLHAFVHMAASLPHEVEIALRVWGTMNHEVREAVAHVDQLRIVGLADALTANGFERVVAQQYSRLSIAALIGAQLSVTPLTEDYLNELLEPLQSDLEELNPARRRDAGRGR